MNHTTTRSTSIRSRHQLAASIGACLALVCTSACVDSLVHEAGETTAEVCGVLLCGSNSPLLGAHDASELHQEPGQYSNLVATGTPKTLTGNLTNQAGIRLVYFTDPGGELSEYRIEPDGELVILSSRGGVRLSGAAVVGSTFRLVHDGTQDYFDMVVDAYHKSLPYWIGAPETLHSYTMRYTTNGTIDSRNLCPGPYQGSGPEREDMLFSTGERYDFQTREIFDIGVPGWAHLACLGDGPSKSLLYRHRPEAEPGDPFYTSPEERQTLLRVWASDFCGNGDTYTSQGHPLEWQDWQDWITPGPTSTVEGIWGPQGVVCLDHPRKEPEITAQDIEAACGKTIPSCSHTDFDDWQNEYYFKTWNP